METKDFLSIEKALYSIALKNKERIASLLVRKGVSGWVSIGISRSGINYRVRMLLLAPIDGETISQVRDIDPQVSIEVNYCDSSI